MNMKKALSLFLALFTVFAVFSQQQQSMPVPQPYNVSLPSGQLQHVSVSFDGSQMLLTVTDQGQSFFYLYVWKNQSWQGPKRIYQVKGLAENAVFDHDMRRIFFDADLGTGNTDIYYIESISGKWSEPKKLDSPVNTDANERDPVISPFSERLFFIRDNSDQGQSCGYVYQSYFKNGKWQKPRVLVQPISLGCESGLSLLVDDKILLMSSKRDDYKNFGIYFTKNLTRGVWLVPRLITISSHSRVNYYSPAVSIKDKKLIFISDDRGKTSLVAVDLPTKLLPAPVMRISGKIVSKNTSEPLFADIYVLNPITNSPLVVYHSDYNGRYDFYLRPKTNYVLYFTAKNYSAVFKNLNIGPLADNQNRSFNVRLFKKINLHLNVFDKEIYQPLQVKITVKNLSLNKIENIPIKQLDRGRYGLQLPIGYHYRFVFENKFYKTDSLDFNLAKTVIYPQYEKDVELTPVIQKVILHVVDIKSGKGVPTVVQIVTEGGHKFTTQVKTDKNGNVVLNLRKGEVYDIAVMPKGYTFFNEKLDLRKPAQKPVKEIVARLKPLEANTKIEFHNITFETNSAELNADSYQELDRLVELLKKNPNIKVEISAHTDNVGSEAYNMKLSLRRAQSVVNYLLEHGVPRSQMIAKGYGETRPLVPNDTPEHRAMNRRVELKILKVNNQ